MVGNKYHRKTGTKWHSWLCLMRRTEDRSLDIKNLTKFEPQALPQGAAPVSSCWRPSPSGHCAPDEDRGGFEWEGQLLASCGFTDLCFKGAELDEGGVEQPEDGDAPPARDAEVLGRRAPGDDRGGGFNSGGHNPCLLSIRAGGWGPPSKKNPKFYDARPGNEKKAGSLPH